MHSYKKVTIVDEQDVVIGAENYFEALEKGSIRRVSRVFVFDDEGKLLLQKRSAHVRDPFLLDQSVGGHVDEGETYFEAAAREMEEELGLKGYALTEVALSYRTDVYNGIYKTIVPTGTNIPFDEHEIESIVWMTPLEVDEAIEKKPEAFTEFFPHIWRELRGMLTQ